MLLDTLGADNYRIFLSDNRENNFRVQLFPAYKANRTQPKPVHHDHLKGFMEGRWNAEITHGQEADDALGINQTEDSVICSIDKDLMQVPGRHYNWVTGVHRVVKESEARYRFWSQVLVGDSTDNITPKQGLSCPGIGEVKAYEALEGEVTEEDYFRQVASLYKTYTAPYLGNDESVRDRLDLTAKLVKIRQQEGEIWTPPLVFSDVGL